MGAIRDLEKRLGVRFKQPDLLQEALLHSSYLNENPGCALQSNERLEFLGDAVLGLVVAHELFTAHPELQEGKLTELRAHLVRRDTLAEAARRLELGAALRLGRGEEADGGRHRPTNLAHAYEAVVGALYVDQGLAAARRFVLKTLQPEFAQAFQRQAPPDPKSRLQELTQARSQQTPVYKLVREEGPDHARRFTVEVIVGGEKLGRGTGSSKQQAEKAAARRALEHLERISPP